LISTACVNASQLIVWTDSWKHRQTYRQTAFDWLYC